MFNDYLFERIWHLRFATGALGWLAAIATMTIAVELSRGRLMVATYILLGFVILLAMGKWCQSEILHELRGKTENRDYSNYLKYKNEKNLRKQSELKNDSDDSDLQSLIEVLEDENKALTAENKEQRDTIRALNAELKEWKSGQNLWQKWAPAVFEVLCSIIPKSCDNSFRIRRREFKAEIETAFGEPSGTKNLNVVMKAGWDRLPNRVKCLEGEK